MHILILNPNSSTEMSKGMLAATEALKLGDSVKLSTYTAPESSPASINDDKDIKASDEAVSKDVSSGNLALEKYDAVLVSCFSVHTLVPHLSSRSSSSVIGIFEASIITAQLLLRPYSDETWGVVTTGKFWEDHLGSGVRSFLGQDANDANRNFAGVFSTGLTAGDFHRVPEEEVTERLEAATGRLLQSGNVRCVVMGCAGMAGLEKVIRSTAEKLYGEEKAKGLYVVDGVRAGVLQLEQMIRSKKIFV